MHTYRDAVDTMLAHLLSPADLSNRIGATDAPYYLWHGETPGDDKGRYWIPALFDQTAIPAILHKMVGGKYRTPGAAKTAMDRFHAGLGNDAVAKLFCNYVEMDDCGRDEQERRLAHLSRETGMEWALQVFSGGKSIHSYIALDRLIDRADFGFWKNIQELLLAAVGGDTKINNPSRLMRLPGYSSPLREQPIIALSGSRYAPQDVFSRLTQYIRTHVGTAPLETILGALRTAEALEIKAKRVGGEDAADMLALAATLRRTRGNPAPADLATADAMLGRGGATVTGGTHTGGTRRGAVVAVPFGALAPFRQLAPQTRFGCPACPPGKSPAGVALGGGSLYCHRCGGLLIEESPTLDQVRALMEENAIDLGELEEAITPKPAPKSAPQPEPEDPNDAIYAAYASYSAELRERSAAKQAAAAPMDDVVRRVVRTALDAAKIHVAATRQLWRAGGIYWRGKGCAEAASAICHPTTGALAIHAHACRGASCVICGPKNFETKAAAAAAMPVTARGTGEIVGAPLGQRPTYEHRVAPENWSSWVRQFARVSQMSEIPQTPPYPPVRGISDIGGGAHGYVASDPRDGNEITAWATLPVQLRGGAVPCVYAPGVDDLAARVREVMLEDLVPINGKVIGRMTSSHGLALDIDSLLRRAYPSVWVAERRHVQHPRDLKETLKKHGFHGTVEKGDDSEVTGCVLKITAALLDPATRVAFLDEITVEEKTPFVVTMEEDAEPIDIDSILGGGVEEAAPNYQVIDNTKCEGEPMPEWIRRGWGRLTTAAQEDLRRYYGLGEYNGEEIDQSSTVPATSAARHDKQGGMHQAPTRGGVFGQEVGTV